MQTLSMFKKMFLVSLINDCICLKKIILVALLLKNPFIFLYLLCFGFKKILTTGGEITIYSFKNLFNKPSFGKRPRQCLYKSKKICNSHGKKHLNN